MVRNNDISATFISSSHRSATGDAAKELRSQVTLRPTAIPKALLRQLKAMVADKDVFLEPHVNDDLDHETALARYEDEILSAWDALFELTVQSWERAMGCDSETPGCNGIELCQSHNPLNCCSLEYYRTAIVVVAGRAENPGIRQGFLCFMAALLDCSRNDWLAALHGLKPSKPLTAA